MSGEKIYIIAETQRTCNVLKKYLEREMFQVDCLNFSKQTIEKIGNDIADFIVIDLNHPITDCIEFCTELKRQMQIVQAPIMMLVPDSELLAIEKGFTFGADFYSIKPLVPKILASRVRAILNDYEFEIREQNVISFGKLTIDPNRFEVRIGEDPINLTVTEFKILELLAQKPGLVFSREQIITGVKGPSCGITSRAVDVQIVGLRKKMGDSGSLLETIRGVGYRINHHS